MPIRVEFHFTFRNGNTISQEWEMCKTQWEMGNEMKNAQCKMCNAKCW
jgi:hypothetical protein